MPNDIVSPWVEQKRSRAEEAARKREAVLATAARLFQEKGFENCTLNDIADALQVTKPTIYYYGKSKELLLVEILNFATEAMVAAFKRAAEMEGSGLERLRTVMLAYSEIRVSDPGRCMALVRDSIMSPENRADLAERGRRCVAYANHIFESGFTDGTIRRTDPALLYNTIFGALNWLPWWMNDEPKRPLRAIVEDQIELFTLGLGGPAAAK